MATISGKLYWIKLLWRGEIEQRMYLLSSTAFATTLVWTCCVRLFRGVCFTFVSPRCGVFLRRFFVSEQVKIPKVVDCSIHLMIGELNSLEEQHENIYTDHGQRRNASFLQHNTHAHRSSWSVVLSFFVSCFSRKKYLSGPRRQPYHPCGGSFVSQIHFCQLK